MMIFLERLTGLWLTNNAYTGKRPLFVWSTKLVDVVPVYQAAEILNRIDRLRQPPRHAKTFVGVKVCFRLYITNQDAPLVFVNAYPLYVRWINLSEITSLGSKRGQAHLAKHLFNSNFDHLLLPMATALLQTTIKVAWCLVIDSNASSACAMSGDKMQKCVADIQQEARLVNFLREIVNVARREKGGEVHFDEALFSPRAGLITAWLSSGPPQKKARQPLNLMGTASGAEWIEPVLDLNNTGAGSCTNDLAEQKPELSDAERALWRSLLARLGP